MSASDASEALEGRAQTANGTIVDLQEELPLAEKSLDDDEAADCASCLILFLRIVCDMLTGVGDVFQLAVNLPREPYKVQVMVCSVFNLVRPYI